MKSLDLSRRLDRRAVQIINGILGDFAFSGAIVSCLVAKGG